MAKIKFGQRVIRGTVYGFLLGFVLGLLGYLMGTAIHALSGQQIVNPIALTMFGVATGFGASLGIELSKDMDEEK